MIRTLLADEWRFLTFRQPSPAIREHPTAFLAAGLLFTWLAGIGRYWDNPRAELWQLLGLGSLAYALVLALILWAFIAPLRPRNWSYRNVLLFVTMTAPPALLYAIPVERFVSMELAMTTNAWFLAAVAAWRVALLVNFLVRTAGLGAGTASIATLMPLSVIVITLTALNLEHVVFELMSGINPEDRSPNDAAYSVVFLLSAFSFMLLPFLVIGYGWCVHRARRSVAEPASAS
jgi:hypothetical protein